MADVITFTPHLGWVDVPNPNEPPANARFITAADLLRYENFGKSAATLLNQHEASLATAGTRIAGAETRITGAETRITGLGSSITSLTGVVDLKAPKASPTFTGNVSGITKAMVGLGNVDNTADASKPVSTAQKTYIDAVGTRVTEIENRRRLWVSHITANKPVGSSSTLLNNIPSLNLIAGHTYQIISGGGGFSDNADTAMQHRVSIATANSTGTNVANQFSVIDTPLWTHPSRPAVGAPHVTHGIHTPTTTGPVRIYSAGQVVIGGGNFTIAAAASSPWSLVVRDLGVAE